MPSPAEQFLSLHRSDPPLLMPNAWDIGSAKILTSLGYTALATTSGGFAATLGRLDGNVTRDEAIAHAAALGDATGLPINADFENGFADDPEGVAETVRIAVEAGVAAGSIEDWSGSAMYELPHAAERIAAAAEVAHAGGETRFALVARAENLLRQVGDLDETIERLLAYEEAGADVLFAPSLVTIEDIRTVVEAVSRPLSVLILPGVPPIAELGEAGVQRISTGGALTAAMYLSLADAATQLRDEGTYSWVPRMRDGGKLLRGAMG